MNGDVTRGHKAASILIVDDTAENLQVLGEMLEDQGYRTRPVTSGKMALQAAHADPPDLVLLDINMPGMDGYEVCASLKTDKKLKDIPVIFISALNETVDKVKAFSLGGVDYITKPFQLEEVRARVDAHLELRRLRIQLELHNRNLQNLVREQVKDISDSQAATIIALAKLAEYRDDNTGKHLERVQTYCQLLATKLSETPRYRNQIDATYIENIYRASPLHDIGKVGIPDNVLLKPGKLTPEEFELMKTHAALGARLLEKVRAKYQKNAFINMGIAITRSYHEKWNGSGYPDGQVGGDITLCARIMAVADVYDALRSKRCYKPAFPHEKSRDIILQDSGTHFDPDVANAFSEVQEDFRAIGEKMED